MTTPAPAPSTDYPGKTLGIVGIVLAFLVPLAGLIVSIIAGKQSKEAGVENKPAKVGLILSIIFLALGVLWFILFIVLAGAGAAMGY